MCGFAGIFTTRAVHDDELRRVANRMSAVLTHRGPDDADTWSDATAGVALGFRRLAILDLSENGRQPMVSPSGRFVIVFNGEVYNFRDLRRRLVGRGFEFRGDSDTEVITAAFDCWGIRPSIEEFVGMFAIAVWDRELRELTVVRDRVGIKPLYLYARDGTVAFASEVKAILAGPVQVQLDRSALVSYLRYLYTPTPRTIFVGISKLPPGHMLTISKPDQPLGEPSCYWSLEELAARGLSDPVSGSEEDALAGLDELLGRAVRERLVADVPLGGLLSGGIDSSTVVSLMQEASTQPVKTFCIGFDEPVHDESDHARRVAEYIGTDHTELRVDGQEALDLVPRLPELFDEPLADPSAIPTFMVSRLARGHVTVALSGDGGDEVFWGYNRYLHGAHWIERCRRIPRLLRGPVAVLAERMPVAQSYRLLEPALPSSFRHRLAEQKVHKLGRLLGWDSVAHMYRSLLSAWDRPENIVIGGEETSTAVDRIVARFDSGSLIERMALADQMEYLVDDLLMKVDRASMSVSLEVRVPLLDHRVIEYAWRLPPEIKARNGEGKWALRRVLERRVPRALTDRPKQGFTVPLAAWLTGPLNVWANDLLSPDRLRREGLLEPEPVRRAWAKFNSGHSELALQIWAVLMFEAWREEWLN